MIISSQDLDFPPHPKYSSRVHPSTMLGHWVSPNSGGRPMPIELPAASGFTSEDSHADTSRAWVQLAKIPDEKRKTRGLVVIYTEATFHHPTNVKWPLTWCQYNSLPLESPFTLWEWSKVASVPMRVRFKMMWCIEAERNYLPKLNVSLPIYVPWELHIQTTPNLDQPPDIDEEQLFPRQSESPCGFSIT